MPGGCVEVAPTSRYTTRTGKSELCVIATRELKPGTTIVDLKGSMADLTDEQDEALKNTGRATGGIRKDFSVIYSASRGVNHLFLGPARFVNVSDPHLQWSWYPLTPISSTIVRTTANLSERVDTLPSKFSSISLQERRSPLTTAKTTVCPLFP
jgi:hypothetical protein